MNTIIERLSACAFDKIEDDDIECLTRAAGDLERKGWSPNEIVSLLKWTEHVDPTITEAFALRHMKRVTDLVEERLRKERVAS